MDDAEVTYVITDGSGTQVYDTSTDGSSYPNWITSIIDKDIIVSSSSSSDADSYTITWTSHVYIYHDVNTIPQK